MLAAFVDDGIATQLGKMLGFSRNGLQKTVPISFSCVYY